MSQPISVTELNTLDRAQFVGRLGGLFEGTPQLATRAWEVRPFASWDELYTALCDAMYALSPEEQLALIRAHPDLAGRAAIAGELTPESTREQASAGLNQLSPDEFARFTRLNNAYQAKFGFPFIICVREHTKSSILNNFDTRLEHTSEQERATALGEIAKIARLRLSDAVAGN